MLNSTFICLCICFWKDDTYSSIITTSNYAPGIKAYRPRKQTVNVQAIFLSTPDRMATNITYWSFTRFCRRDQPIHYSSPPYLEQLSNGIKARSIRYCFTTLLFYDCISPIIYWKWSQKSQCSLIEISIYQMDTLSLFHLEQLLNCLLIGESENFFISPF